MRLGLFSVILLWGCSEDIPRDPTGQEISSAAAKCQAVVIDVSESSKSGPTNRQLGLPNVYVTIESAEFSEKANCLHRELMAAGTYAGIHGPNGEDLVAGDGRDRIQ